MKPDILTVRRDGKRGAWIVLTVLLAILVGVGTFVLWIFNLGPFQGRYYTMEELGIERLRSARDFDGDGIDDWTEILNGARKDAERHPRYDGSYVQGGFPPETQGVCTDVIWRAFLEAGYDLREMVDQDIKARSEAYSWVMEPDKNIDFRRVVNLAEFFREHGEELTTDIEKVEEWQPGDIVIFGRNEHIGIVSDRRNKNGRPYIIHNGGQPNREEDYLKRAKVTVHYRFMPEAEKI